MNPCSLCVAIPSLEYVARATANLQHRADQAEDIGVVAGVEVGGGCGGVGGGDVGWGGVGVWVA